MNIINITEHYESETSCNLLINYDLASLDFKKIINKALAVADKSLHIDVYEEGLQSLEDNDPCIIRKASAFTSKITEYHSIEFYG